MSSALLSVPSSFHDFMAYGTISFGLAVIGFVAGSIASRRKRSRGKRAYKAATKRANVRSQPQVRHSFIAGEEHKPLLRLASTDQDVLLEYNYRGMPESIRDFSRDAPAPDGGTTLSQRTSPTYNHGLAKALCNLAGRAYMRPMDYEGFRVHNIQGQPTVTFFDTAHLLQAFKGLLRVQVHSANDLRSADLGGSANPYLEVFLAGSSLRTQACAKRTLNPVWEHEELWLYVRDPACDALCVRVADEDNSYDSDDLGVSVLGLAGLAENAHQEHKFKLPLRGLAGEGSTVTISCCYQQLTESVLESIPALKQDDVMCTTEPAPIASLEEGGLKPMAYIDCSLTDTQVWLFVDAHNHRLVFAFRGTEQNVLTDVITDANLWPCAFKSIISSGKNGVRIHRGFMRAYRSVRTIMSSLLKQVTASDSDHEFWEVMLTGHSLGGALATLAAYEVAIYKHFVGRVKSVSLYTYGSPRVGNKAFAKHFDTLVPDAWRFTNRLDIVPSIPPTGPLFKFCHVGHPVRLREGGFLLQGLSSTEVEKAGQKPDKSIQRDINWLRALLSFRGTAEHSCDLYAKRLGEALDKCP